MIFLKFTFHSSDKTQHELLIAQLSRFAVEGFEEKENELVAFFNKEKADDELIEFITALETPFFMDIVKQQNWNEEWEKNFQPVVISNSNNEPFLYIRAGFHPKLGKPVSEIVITPKMSFGTGHHPTTTMMLQLMNEITWKQKEVIDLGTGTGVLAIYAAQCGAAKVLAIDNDEWSIKNAVENITLNRAMGITVLSASTIPENQQADVILANINTNIIISHFDTILNSCKTGGIILLSGMLCDDEMKIRELAISKRVKSLTVRNTLNWMAIRIDL